MGTLIILWDETQRELFGLTNVIDAFEQIMQDPEEKRNLSPCIANIFSDLAILSRALIEVENYLPWAATFEEEHKVSTLFQLAIRPPEEIIVALPSNARPLQSPSPSSTISQGFGRA